MWLLVLAILLASAPAHAEPAHSYAYVTGSEAVRFPASMRNAPEECDVVARLPAALVTTRPANDDRSLLGADAIRVDERTDDPNADCSEFLHTWLPVDFDTNRPADVHFTLPDHRFSISDAIMILVIGIVVTTVAREKLAARRARQRPKR
jgi:hypothetical protein